MEKELSKKISLFLAVLGTAILVIVFIHWSFTKSSITWYGWLAAFASASLAWVIYIKFVPKWMDFWGNADEYGDGKLNKETDVPRYTYIKIFSALTVFCVFTLLLIFFIRYTKGYAQTFSDSLAVWMETDARHYQDIAKEWYLSEGEWDRLVQLVFLPGYPLLIKAAVFIIHDYYKAGFIVSVLSYATSGCMLYKLMRLDFTHSEAMRAIKYLCIMPASFFFAGPMSESLFLLMSISCIYCIRTKKWVLGCFFGGYASFTRSLGITLIVPLIFELVNEICRNNTRLLKKSYIIKNSISVLLIPTGFAMYCVINYMVSGDFLKFMEYQSRHWSQNPGWFFNTASYQTELIVGNWGENYKIIAGLWAPNVLMIFSALVLMIFAVKKLRPGYTAWFIAYFIVAIGATWLLSAPRYLAGFAALPVAAADVTCNKKADTVMTICCISLNIIYLYTFSVRWYVW